MKTTITILLFVCGLLFHGNTQISNQSLFAQGLLTIDNKPDLQQKEADLRNHPNIELCRLDFETKRFFILTKSLDQLTEAQLHSWFQSVDLPIYCIQIGRIGLDTIRPYPFVDCSNE